MKTHLQLFGPGRKRRDGLVRTRCGRALSPVFIGAATCQRCLDNQKAAQRVEDEDTLEAFKQIKRERMAKYRRENPEKYRATQLAYEAKSREKIRARTAEYRKVFHEECLERTRQWRAKHPGYDTNHQRKARELRGAT